MSFDNKMASELLFEIPVYSQKQQSDAPGKTYANIPKIKSENLPSETPINLCGIKFEHLTSKKSEKGANCSGQDFLKHGDIDEVDEVVHIKDEDTKIDFKK